MAEACTDRLDALLNHFPVHAHVFHSGSLCGTTDFSAPGSGGQLHLVRDGTVEVINAEGAAIQVTEPSLLLYSRPLARRFITDAKRGVDMACANLHFEGGVANPISSALPDFVCLPLKSIEGADDILALLFDEAFGDRCGRHALVDRLFEAFLIQVLRYLMETGGVRGGMLAGMAHAKLRKALVAMHNEPANEWSLESLAQIAGMSRSVFANAFRDTVGCTPGAYLQRWRIRLVQKALRQGRQLKMISVDVGYGSEAALSRAFKAQSGLTPREWLRTQNTR